VSVVILLADGARPDTLAAAIAGGVTPALARLRDEGGAFDVTSCFPSVTGPAYAPFLMGRYPGPIGLPGLRWFDRARAVTTFPDYSRSYVGHQMHALDGDLDADAPTIFELADTSLGALSVIGRGLAKRDRVGGMSLRSALRAAYTHFRGDVAGWLDIDREVADTVVERVARERPEFVFAAFTGVDKVSHSAGHDAPAIAEAMRIVDATAARIRADAERAGRWEDMSLWVVSDHGHSPVSRHEDLERVVQAQGYRTMAHPWVFSRAPDVAVMVSGNAMAHLYVDPSSRERSTRGLPAAYEPLYATLLSRPSVDLMIVPHGMDASIVSATRGTATVRMTADGYEYRRESGDPLRVGGDVAGVSADAAYDATIGTDYPDSIVQIAHLATAPRSGDIILSAARDWDFRARYEPIPHVSSHGALHRDHIMVPLLLNRPPARPPRRTVDVMPSALAALRCAVPAGLDGASFF